MAREPFSPAAAEVDRRIMGGPDRERTYWDACPGFKRPTPDQIEAHRRRYGDAFLPPKPKPTPPEERS